MSVVDIRDARARLTELVGRLERGSEVEIIITRDGRPAARLVPLSPEPATSKRLGLLQGRYPAMSLDDFNATDAIVTEMFYGKNI